MDGERDACVDDERLVLSEVHIGSSSAADAEADVISRYTYLVPSDQINDDDNNSSSDSSDSDSDNEGGTRGRGSGGGCSSPTRCRKRPLSEALSTATPQQRRSRPAHEVLTIVHRMATPLGLVGQQVWSAAFLLSDFVLTHPRIFADMQVLELGAGPGVAGLIAARVARRCYLTDYHNEVLKLLARNVEANLHLFAQDGCSSISGNSTAAATAEAAEAMLDDGSHSDSDNNNSAHGAGGAEKRNTRSGQNKHGGDRPGQVAAVRELNWFTFSQEEGPTDNAICPQVGERKKDNLRALSNGEGTQRATTMKQHADKDDAKSDDDVSFDWRKGELERLSSPLPSETGEPRPLVILAADVIYDEGLTEAFFDMLKLLMPPQSPPASPSGRPGQNAPPPSHGNDDDRSRQDGASREANGGARGPETKETGHKTSRGSSRSASAEVSEDNEPLSSAQRQNCASSAASLSTSNTNADVQTDSKDQEWEEPPTKGGRTSSFGAGGEGGAVLYLALEKRFNFSLAELSVSATGYKALLGNVMDVTDGVDRRVGACASRRKAFEGTRLPLAFQQCFRYKRSDAMEIWEIRRRPAS